MSLNDQDQDAFFQKVSVRHPFVRARPVLVYLLWLDQLWASEIVCHLISFIPSTPWQVSHCPLFVTGSSRDSIHVQCSMRLQAFPVWICSLNLLQDKEAGFGRQPITPHASTSSLDYFSRLLSTLFVSLAFCEEKGKERQIRLLPQKLPITAWRCVQHRCLANAEFVNPVQRQGICELNFEAVVLNESSTGAWVSERIAYKTWNKLCSAALFTFLYEG